MKCVKSCFLLSERLAGWLLQQNSLGSSYLDKNPSTLGELWALSDWVCHTTFYFPIAVKTCWIISIKFENFRKRSSPARQLSREKMISNRLVRQFLVRAAFSLNNDYSGLQWVFSETSETYKEWGPDYQPQPRPTKNYHKTGRFMLWQLF